MHPCESTAEAKYEWLVLIEVFNYVAYAYSAVVVFRKQDRS